MIFLRRINGNSMQPTVSSGDYIVALKYYFKPIRAGDIVIVNHPQYNEIIKRVKHIDNQGNYWLIGDGADSLSTAKMGAICPAQILGKLYWRIPAKTTS